MVPAAGVAGEEEADADVAQGGLRCPGGAGQVEPERFKGIGSA